MATTKEEVKENHFTQLVSASEYLALDGNAQVRYEYHDGVVRAMSGGTFVHNTIVGNILSYLRLKAFAQKCRAFAENVRFQVKDTRFFYPDIVVTCDALDDTQGRTLIKACFVAEVLSTSTLSDDFGRKLYAYMNNPYLQTIAYISQTEKKVFVYQKNEDNWNVQDLIEGEFLIPCIDTVLTLDQIYEMTPMAESDLAENG